jgi:two-component system, cell cycle sensor histidine kinase and response regulator CckA
LNRYSNIRLTESMQPAKKKHHNSPFLDDIGEIKEALRNERRARRIAEERVRVVAAEHKRLEIELIRYRDHFESLVANRTAELMSINEKLLQENRERRLAERERRSFEDQFREATLLMETVLNAIPDIIGVQDMNHRVIRFNKAGYDFFGKSRAEVIGKCCFELIGQQAPCDTCVVKELVNTSQSIRLIKYFDDKGLWMDIRAYPIFDMDGRIVRIVEHWRDITELKNSTASLKESEEKYRLLVENSDLAIFIFQADEVKFSNRNAKEMVKIIGRHRLKNSLLDCIHIDECLPELEALHKRLNGFEEHPHTMVLRILDAEDNTRWIEANTVNINWQGQPATLNFIRDITRSKQLEHRFQEAQRMESLGTLAGGIAHDFNNLLMGIQGNVSLMYLDIEPNNELYEKLESIENCVESGSRLTKQLLGFARGGKYVVKPIDMNHVVKSSAEMFGRTHRSVKIHGDYETGLWTVPADASQIEQVMVNILLNAFQAMHGNGDLYLQTGNTFLDAIFVKPHDISPGPYVKISVTDNGIGMDEETRRRIFEPFFSTHDPGMGTGLGLASVFGIVKNHNGCIVVKSKVGKGSTFEVYLPATSQQPEIECVPSDSIQSGSETILLVDDEEYILEIGQLMLEGLGYTFFKAACGKAAIDLFAEHHREIDLVILDLVMPDMDGETVFHELRRIAPDIKVVFASGFYIVDQTHGLLENYATDFLQKPFNLKQLSTRLRSMLTPSA